MNNLKGLLANLNLPYVVRGKQVVHLFEVSKNLRDFVYFIGIDEVVL